MPTPMTVPILKAYLKRLTNLSSRNRSLLLGSLPAEQFLDLHELDFLDNFASFELIRQLIAQKNTIKLCDVADPRSAKINDASKKLRKIARTQTFIEEERGAQDLYVGWPFVRGKLMDGTPIHGPLLFFAVTLQATEKHWQLRRRDEPSTINRSFLLAYSHFNQVTVSEELLETNLDDLNHDALNFRTELYELLRDSPLKINFNQDLFQEKLQPFSVLKAADLELLERNGELKLYSEAVLGIFPQAGSYLAPDYETLIAGAKGEGLKVKGESEKGKRGRPCGEGEEVKIEKGEGESIAFFGVPLDAPKTSKEENTFTAFEQDASQEEALHRVKAGESLVVQGPPGTGKSQLIANLMADFAARGKRVLLVCQKRVALDVVQQRLQSVGMAPFVALIHDFKNDRAALYQQLAAQIDQIEAYQKQNEGLDALFLERKFRQASRVIEQSAEELATFKTALFDESDCGISPKELYLTSNPNAPQIDLSADFRAFKFDDRLADFLQRLRQYEAYSLRLPPAHCWQQRVDFADFNFLKIKEIEQKIATVIEVSTAASNAINCFLHEPLGIESIYFFKDKLALITEMSVLLKNDKTATIFEKIFFQNAHFSSSSEVCREIKIDLLAALESPGIERSLPNELVINYLVIVQDAIRQQSSLLGRMTFAFSKDKKIVANLLHQNGLSDNSIGLSVLLLRLQKRLDFDTVLNIDLVAKNGETTPLLSLNPKTVEAENIAKEYFELCNAARAAEIGTVLKQKLAASVEETLAFWEGFLPKLALHIKALTQTISNVKVCLTNKQVNQLIQEPAIQHQYLSLLRQDFDLLVEADKLKAGFSNVEWTAVQQLQALAVGQSWEAVFQNALRLIWLEHLENKYPILRAVSSLKIGQLEENLQENVLQKQSLSREILLLKLREQTYQDLTFNRLQNRVTYRDLQHQVMKKRKIWPVRKLLETHADGVFKLVPCWLASPESVSALFPLVEGLFDLVIFDEASQCYAEYGLPALFRGKQAVVAGDSQQLTPNDLYRIRYDVENEEENPELEVESLLGLVAQYLPQTQLQGHYRSQSLALIAFSNQHFYRNKLQILPHFEAINRQEPTIKYVKVEGVWQQNTNVIEAEHIIELVQELRQQNPEKSIGVVTFNQPQQQLIEALEWQQRGGARAELFIKNIENVQGDERDIIIFSVGYAPDASGKLRAQFGSLNASGGQNRLNVAITRARERIYVVTSIWPQQLQVADTTHEGPKLLKKYLEYALEVSEGRFQSQLPQLAGQRNEWFLKKKIENNDPNSSLKEELPFADLTHKKGERYESLMLTDDDLFFQSRSTKEAHAYWPLQLRAKGWSFERVWSREWWRKGRD